jgi:hypothetical protein
MPYTVQFLDGSTAVIAEWSAYALTSRGAIELVEGARWPSGAVCMRILDADGRMVHARLRADAR